MLTARNLWETLECFCFVISILSKIKTHIKKCPKVTRLKGVNFTVSNGNYTVWKKKKNKPTTKKKKWPDGLSRKKNACRHIHCQVWLSSRNFQKFNLIHIVTYLSMYIWQGTSKNLCVPVWLWWITKKIFIKTGCPWEI